MFKASPFKLQLYDTCPAQYKFVYVDHIADDYKTSKPYLTMGAHVHNALHDFYAKHKVSDRTLECLENLLRKRWAENRSGFVSTDDERKWGLKALNMLKLFLAKMDMHITPSMLEDYYSYDIDSSLKVLGRIDRVDETHDGLHVIDYKTGVYSEVDVNEMQLTLYSLIISKQTHQRVSKASFLYLPSFTWHTIEPQEEDYDYIVENVRLKVKKIMQDQAFAPHINKYCKNCDFLEICPKKEQVEDYIKERNVDSL